MIVRKQVKLTGVADSLVVVVLSRSALVPLAKGWTPCGDIVFWDSDFVVPSHSSFRLESGTHWLVGTNAL
ncbi:hypothetical protein GUJ93_ZPchr0002g25183 [Zizania palustris]|uniref:Uncharacterized protein n=1 Tax=Zizania palustris TaxID=103762 RepID=A0A8J5RY00_ZIZPA|nr:hypothetical protein GUJ93_ZPchr0002g25183 [Zizania palustris]